VRKILGKFVEEEDEIWNNFVIATSSDSPHILNYSKDSESNQVGPNLFWISLLQLPLQID
jgi:hypothetical protein